MPSGKCFASHVFAVATLAATLAFPALALPAQAQSPEASAIDAMMQKSADDWNRGDLNAFATCYKRSPEIEFIGPTISHGYDGMLATYREHYPTREKMGTLSFSKLDVKPLDARFATVTGWFHLERTAAGGGSADGYFLLVVEKTADGWKIIRDDTTAHAPLTK
jgi:ketosteroid isomerase-like protein